MPWQRGTAHHQLCFLNLQSVSQAWSSWIPSSLCKSLGQARKLQPRGQVTTREHSTHLTKGCHPSHVGWGWKGDYLVWPNSLVVPKCPQTSSYWGQHLSLTNIEEYQTVIYFDCSQMHPRVPSPSTPTWFLVQAQDTAWSWPPKQMHVGFSCPIQIFSEIPQMQPNLSVNES